MDYTYPELLCYLLIYSFIGWVVEVILISVRDRALKNRGFFNLPFCLSYGVIMDILILIVPTMDNLLVQYLAALAVSSVVTFLSGSISKHISRTSLWEYQENNLFSCEKRPLLLGLLQGLVFLLAVQLLHPLVFALVALLPASAQRIICGVIFILLAADFVIITVTLRTADTPEAAERLLSRGKEQKRSLGERVLSVVWKRIDRAYPALNRMEAAEKPVFAQGICLNKLVWVFLFACVFGDVFETLFVWATTGRLMSRSSLIYGPFSVVWGFGAVLLTVVLQRLAGKEDRYVFLAGCLIGGVYEYMCSVATEVFLGTTFWDYSDMPFNFGGRTNLLFCIFWGLLSVVWIKKMYPALSFWIEKIPPVVGTILTWVIVALFVLDGGISAAALLRYVERIDVPAASDIFAQFLDTNYPDSLIETIWPNLRIAG